MGTRKSEVLSWRVPCITSNLVLNSHLSTGLYVSITAMIDKMVARVKAVPIEIEIIKGLDPEDERYVFGIVLEPDTTDAHLDTVDSGEIESAAHRYIVEFDANRKIMHRDSALSKSVLLETGIALEDMSVAGMPVKKGTWFMAWRITDDDTWLDIKEGRLTGYSIGGRSVREPV